MKKLKRLAEATCEFQDTRSNTSNVVIGSIKRCTQVGRYSKNVSIGYGYLAYRDRNERCVKYLRAYSSHGVRSFDRHLTQGVPLVQLRNATVTVYIGVQNGQSAVLAKL